MPPERPVIDAGTPGMPVLVMDPMVLADAEGYHLFYSTFFCKSVGRIGISWDSIASGPESLSRLVSAIGYGFSADKGITWQLRSSPVFVPGENDWEKHKVETAFVVRRNGQLLLFYSALGNRDGHLLDNRFQLGVARLPLGARGVREALLDTGATFERFRTTPLVPFNLTETSFVNNVQEPSVVCRDGRFEVYFLGIALKLPDQTPDAKGQKFLRIGLGRAIFDEGFREIERTDKPLLEGVNMPEVTFHDGRYWLFSTGFGKGPNHKGEFLQVCSSEDGLHWQTPRAILAPQREDGFDNWALAAPTVVWDQRQLLLFYSAFGASPAKSSDFRKQVGPFSLTNRRWTIFVPQEQRTIAIDLGRAVKEVQPGSH
jgi:predicted GH43/DUF377 family glycosyl hydrolase